jgi:hypothetical protein
MCPVCIDRRADTKEDVVPQWARDEYAKFGEYSGGLPSVLMPMCSICNGQFGRNFENFAAPIMRRMVSGEPVANGRHLTLTPTQQTIIGEWTIKTLLLTYLARSQGPADKLEMCRQICCDMKVHKTPPHQSFVRIGWINAHPHRDQGPPHQDLHEVGSLPGAAYFGVCSLGFLVWEAVVGDPHDMEPFVNRVEDTDHLIRVWPPQIGSTRWPPRFAMSDADLDVLRQGWTAGLWPPPPDTLLNGIRLVARTKPPETKPPHDTST